MNQSNTGFRACIYMVGVVLAAHSKAKDEVGGLQFAIMDVTTSHTLDLYLLA